MMSNSTVTVSFLLMHCLGICKQQTLQAGGAVEQKKIQVLHEETTLALGSMFLSINHKTEYHDNVSAYKNYKAKTF